MIGSYDHWRSRGSLTNEMTWDSLNWDRLRVLAAVAEQRSVAAAADYLHVTSSAVTQQLRKLEKDVGTCLVAPAGRGMRLTTEGELLATAASRIAGLVNDARRDLEGIHERVGGPLNIGAVASALRVLVPQVLRTLTIEYPHLKPTVRDGEITEMIPALVSRRLDAVILESWSSRPAALPDGVELTSLLCEEAWIALPEDHPLAGEETVRLDELGGHVWTSCPPGSDSSEALSQLLRMHIGTADIRYFVADYSTQLTLVAAGIATAMVPRVARSPQPGVRFSPCTPTISRSIDVATAIEDQNPATRAFVAALKGAATRAVQGFHNN